MGYLGKTWLVDMTIEYRSPDFHGAYGREFLLVLLVSALVLALARRRMSWPHVVAFLGTTAFALHSMRNIPLWALVGLPLVALHLDPAWRAITWGPLVKVRGAFAGGAQAALAGLWSTGAAVLLLFLAGTGGRIGGNQLLQTRFDRGIFPMRVVEKARANHVSGRLFNELAWGGYILHVWPEQKVFIDGQTDFYGEPLSRLYASVRAAEPGWEWRLDSMGVQLVLIPSDARLAQALTGKQAWSTMDSADGATLFIRAR
jgi:hypothetical protein